eukprot:TRINITY_DN6954_c0_g2_i2.p4 TRINITY_DN6954_c0_g2~~TRINITY_DN6954_c0_g2_i2.p4  ORF type:complete len:103 (+),score=21.81 TRINITY_DN6954_c0_g2_i2:880-1188(+)
MEGELTDVDNMGIIPRSVHTIFEQLESLQVRTHAPGRGRVAQQRSTCLTLPQKGHCVCSAHVRAASHVGRGDFRTAAAMSDPVAMTPMSAEDPAAHARAADC